MGKAGDYRLTVDSERNLDVTKTQKTPSGSLVDWMGRFKVKEGKLMFMTEKDGPFVGLEFEVRDGKPYMEFALTSKLELLEKIGVKVGKDRILSLEDMETAVEKKDELRRHGSVSYIGRFESIVKYKREIDEAAAVMKDAEALLKNHRVVELLDALDKAREDAQRRDYLKKMRKF